MGRIGRIDHLTGLVLALAILMAVGIGCGGDKSSATTPANGPAAADEKPVTVDAKTLTSDYDRNELNADAKYKGKTLIVSGKITDIAETFGHVTVQLDGAKPLLTVMCNFEDDQRSSVSTLTKGSKATFKGIGDGKTSGLYVGLDKCQLQP